VISLDESAPPVVDQIRMLAKRGALALPPLPQVTTRLLGVLRDEDTADLNEAGGMIENEPALAASVLRMANSASFGGLRRLSDLSEAISRLGLRQVGTLVTACSTRGNFESDDPESKRILQTLWDHAVAVALATRRLAAESGGDPAEAFLAGLLHDTGKLLVLKAVDHLGARDRERAGLSPGAVDELMETLHCELGHLTLTHWRIPDGICEVALHHHDRLQGGGLTAQVQVANEVARKLGASLHPDPGLDLLDLPAVEALNLGDFELATVMVDVEEEFARVRQLFA
jgi:HD-like signal output (HDOD) protein